LHPHFLSPRSVSTEIPILVSRLTGKIQLTVSECNAPVQAKQALKLIPIALYAPAFLSVRSLLIGRRTVMAMLRHQLPVGSAFKGKIANR
jgi:hypothetical protein